MSAIAQVLVKRGNRVSGSDRSLDQGKQLPVFDQLRGMGVSLHPQDGSGIGPDCDFVVASTAIEKTVPDMARAIGLGVAVKHRSDLLAEIFNAGRGVAAGGTSGKSTVTGITGWMLDCAGLDPCIINGGKMKNYASADMPGNARAGLSEYVVIESDESDGSLVKYEPHVSIVTNITKDHKPMDELRELFGKFVRRTAGTAVLNADCPVSSSLAPLAKKALTFGIENEADVRATDCRPGTTESVFTVDGEEYAIRQPGMHSIANALAAMAAGRALGLDGEAIRRGIEGFEGIKRRYELVGEAAGVKVIDDFGHNPDKIRATLAALHLEPGRRLVVFQPHGFGPTKFMRDELVEVLSTDLGPEDVLLMPEIFYAGGTADKSISSRDITEAVKAAGKNAQFFETRGEIAPALADMAAPGDIITVMGARDDTLTLFCHDILDRLKTND